MACPGSNIDLVRRFMHELSRRQTFICVFGLVRCALGEGAAVARGPAQRMGICFSSGGLSDENGFLRICRCHDGFKGSLEEYQCLAVVW